MHMFTSLMKDLVSEMSAKETKKFFNFFCVQ